MTDSILSDYPYSEHERANNMSSGAFTGFLGLGQVLGPLFGTQMIQILSFRWATDIQALICLVFALVYFFLCDGISAFKQTKFC